MKVIFLDFDGVLNSQASFIYETVRRRKGEATGPTNQTLCNVCTAVFQHALNKLPEVKIVISSTWRNCFEMDWLKAKLASYGIDSSRVIDRTPVVSFSRRRGEEIGAWLEDHPEVTDFVIIDDDSDMGQYMDKLVKTDWYTGMTLYHAQLLVDRLGGAYENEEN